jgi:YVTN family beta-propeller protein
MARRASRRVLATVLFTDIVDSSRIAGELGDRRWKTLLGRHHDAVRRELRRHGGRELDTAGDGFFASFDSQDAAIRCAGAVVESVQRLGIDVRAGIHAGQAEVLGSKLGGVAVHICARVMGLAGPAEVLVTSVIKDLVAGAGFAFADRGEHPLKGIEGSWHVWQVTSVERPLPPPLSPDEAARRRAVLEPPPPPRRFVLVTIAGLLVVVVVLVGLAVFRRGSAAPARAAAPPTHLLLKLDPRTGRVLARIPIGLPAPQSDGLSTIPRLPHGVAVGEGSVWVTNENSDTVTRIDPVHDRVTATIRVRSPDAIAVVPGAVWVSGDGTPATWINPGDNGPVEIALPAPLAEGLAVDADPDTGTAFFTGEPCTQCVANAPVTVAQLARSTEVLDTVSLGHEFSSSAVLATPDVVWVTAGSNLYRIERATSKVSDPIHIEAESLGQLAIEPSSGHVWLTTLVANGQSGEAVEIDPATRRIVARQPIGCCPGAIAIGGGFIWVTNSRLGDLQRISLVTGDISSIHVGRPGKRLLWKQGSERTTAYGVDGIAFGYGAVWVTVDLSA